MDMHLPLRVPTGFYIDTSTSSPAAMEDPLLSPPAPKPRFKIPAFIISPFKKSSGHAKKSPFIKFRLPSFRSAGFKKPKSCSATSASPSSVLCRKRDSEDKTSSEGSQSSRPSPISDLLDDITRNAKEGGDEEIKWDLYACTGDDLESITADVEDPLGFTKPSTMQSCITRCRRNLPHLALKPMLKRVMIIDPLAILMQKMVLGVSHSQGLFLGMLSDAKRRMVLLAASEMHAKEKEQEEQGLSLCNKRILMGRKCRPLEPEVSLYGNKRILMGRRCSPLEPDDSVYGDVRKRPGKPEALVDNDVGLSWRDRRNKY